MDWIVALGIFAGTLTSAMMVPQVRKTWKTKKVEDIALGTYVTASIGLVLWLVYGIFKNDIALMISNSAGLLLNITMIFFKFRYHNK